MGIDATWKEKYPRPVEMSAEISERVRNRWKEYGLD
jgi:3-polyprenyl-4-hydroxybenzoate decarboxylase